MRLPAPWLALPAADASGIAAELAATKAAWEPDDGFDGSYHARRSLLADAAGPLAEGACPRLAQWLSALDAPWRAVDLRRYATGAHTALRADAGVDSRERMLIVIALTDGLVIDTEAGRVPLRAGQAGAVDTWRRHRFANTAAREALFVTADTTGSPALWDALARMPPAPEARMLRLDREAGRLDPWRVEAAVGALLAEARTPPSAAVLEALARFGRKLRGLWAAGGAVAECVATTRTLLIDAGVERTGLRNGLGLLDALDRQVFGPLLGAAKADAALGRDTRFDRPVFIVSLPRSGSTLLFETLSRARGVVTIGDESHQLIEGIPSLAPAARGFDSNRLVAADADVATACMLRTRFLDNLRDRDGHRVDGIGPVRMLEKTPKNALRVPFLRAAFPEARFVYLHRDPRQVIASMIESWESGRFRTYPQLPGWRGAAWSLLLVPGWRDLVDAPLGDIVGHQWATTQRILLDDLDDVPATHRLGVDYAQLLADPEAQVRRICDWAVWDWDRGLGESLPLSRYTNTRPDAEKWRRRQDVVEAQLSRRAELCERAERAASVA